MSLTEQHSLVVVLTILMEMLRAPAANTSQWIYYGKVLMDLFENELTKTTIPPAMADAMDLLYARMDAGDGINAIALRRLVRWFSHHLGNFDFKWETWEAWAAAAKVSSAAANNASATSNQALFLQETLRHCTVLAYHEKIQEKVPEDVKVYLPPAAAAVHIYDDGEAKQQTFFKLLLRQVEHSEGVSLAWLAMQVNPSQNVGREDNDDGTQWWLSYLLHALLQGGEMTFTHLVAVLRRHATLLKRYVILHFLLILWTSYYGYLLIPRFIIL